MESETAQKLTRAIKAGDKLIRDVKKGLSELNRVLEELKGKQEK